MLVHEPSGEHSLTTATVRAVAWIGKRGARLLVVKEDAFSMLLRLAGPEAAEEAWGMCCEAFEAFAIMTVIGKSGYASAPAV